MKLYGFYIYEAKTTDRYGGNIQAHFTLQKMNLPSNVKKILKIEKDNEWAIGHLILLYKKERFTAHFRLTSVTRKINSIITNIIM